MADSTSSRWMVIEDSDSRVRYSGSWFSDSYRNPGPHQAPGDITKGTAHGTNSRGGFTVRYEGDSIVAWAVSSRPPGNGVSIRCTLDGKEARTMLLGPGHSDGLLWTLCEGISPTSGTHELVVDITSNDGTVVWLENLTYLSPSSPDLSNGYSLIPPDAAAVQYVGPGWDMDVNKESTTNIEGSGFVVQFYGTSIELRSFLLASMPRVASSATFSIDGGPERSFPLPVYVDGYRGLEPGKGRWRISTLTTPPLVNGAHTLKVTYRGGQGQVPLTVDYFVVAHPGARVDATTNLGLPSSEPSTGGLGQAGSSSGHSKNSRAIPGGIVAALFLLFLLIFLVLRFMRRRRRLDRDSFMYEELQETTHDPAFIPPTISEKVMKSRKGDRQEEKGKGKYEAMRSEDGDDDDDGDLDVIEGGGNLYDLQRTGQPV